MALKICEAGLITLAQDRVTEFNGLGMKLKLFQNNHTPAVGDTAADYTEATFGGYAALTLNAWTYNGITADVTLIQETLRYWTWSGSPANTIYGYYITLVGGQLMWAELNPAGPITMSAISDIFVVLPRFTGQNL